MELQDIDNVGSIFAQIVPMIKRAVISILNLPLLICYVWPYMLCTLIGLDKPLKRLADRINLNTDMFDPIKVEEWVRNRYADSDETAVNYNLKEEYIRELFDEEKVPAAFRSKVRALETTAMFFGMLPNGISKDRMFAGHHMSPAILASAFYETRGRAALVGLLACLTISICLLSVLHGFIGFDSSVHETWGSLGVASSFSWSKAFGSWAPSLLTMGIILSPFLLLKKLARNDHFVIAYNEVLADIKEQMLEYGGFEAAKESLSVYPNKLPMLTYISEGQVQQLDEYTRMVDSGEPLIPIGLDDGYAKSLNVEHSKAPNSPVMQSQSEAQRNTLITGSSGSGKTLTYGIPYFDATVQSFLKADYAIQGLCLDGKGSLHHRLKARLRKRGVPQENFNTFGVKPDELGMNMFDGLSTEKVVEFLKYIHPQVTVDFWVISALDQISRVVRIAKAIHLTPIGVEYQVATNGCSTDSPEFVKRLCNNKEMLFKYIADLTNCLEIHEGLRYALYDEALKGAINGCLEEWATAPDEQLGGFVATINMYLNPFTSNSEILTKYGQGRSGDGYGDMRMALQGQLFFSSLSELRHGDAARAVNTFVRSRLYNLLAERDAEYQAIGKDPQKEPVIVLCDEHHLMVSVGTTGASDTNFANISRSMGMMLILITQSLKAYEQMMARAMVDNLTEQMGTRGFLSMKSEEDARWIEANCGTVTHIKVFCDGVLSTEGARELANNGVMTVPRTKIRALTRYGNLGMPSTIVEIKRNSINVVDMKHTFGIFGYFGKTYTYSSGVPYIRLINAPSSISKMKAAVRDSRNKFSVMGALGFIEPDKSSEVVSSSEWEMEYKGRSEGLHDAPPFTQTTSLANGNAKMIITTPQFGKESWFTMRVKPLLD